MAITYRDLAQEVLGDPSVKYWLTPNQIWKLANTKFSKSVAKLSKKSSNPGATLYGSLHQESSTANARFVWRDDPFRLCLKEREGEKEMQDSLPEEDLSQLFGGDSNQPRDRSSRKSAGAESRYEAGLHPLLCYYARHDPKFGGGGREVLTKTINHTKGPKKEGLNKWVFPDMVGVYLPRWHEKVLEFGKKISGDLPLLFSFEIKKELRLGNYSEAFFQAVSNSSWANEGYLVAAEINGEDNFRSELRRLSGSFGIGIVHLRLDDFGASEILFPARRNPRLDWETMNKLAKASPDFEAFLSSVRIDFDCGRAHNEDYDKVEKDIDAYIEKIALGDSADKAQAAKKSARAGKRAAQKRRK